MTDTTTYRRIDSDTLEITVKQPDSITTHNRAAVQERMGRRDQQIANLNIEQTKDQAILDKMDSLAIYQPEE